MTLFACVANEDVTSVYLKEYPFQLFGTSATPDSELSTLNSLNNAAHQRVGLGNNTRFHVTGETLFKLIIALY